MYSTLKRLKLSITLSLLLLPIYYMSTHPIFIQTQYTVLINWKLNLLYAFYSRMTRIIKLFMYKHRIPVLVTQIGTATIPERRKKMALSKI